MRQAGYLAAAGIYALENNVKRLEEDHRKAKEIGTILASCSYVKKVEPIETNIVIFYVNDNLNPNEFIQKMEAKDILLISMGEGKIRIVTHLDYTQQMHEKLLFELQNF